jgi:hypothetical protein
MRHPAAGEPDRKPSAQASHHRLAGMDPGYAVRHNVRMSTVDSEPRLPAAAADDIAYVEASFCAMSEAARELVKRGVLPEATYFLPDGTPMVPADHAVLLDDAGGDPDAIAGLFRDRYLAAGGNPAEVDAEHSAWLSGGYGACLRSTTPEAIVAKGGLMSAITALLASPTPEEQSWRMALRGAVDSLDALERPFAAYDRERFGGPTSRDRLITATRMRFPELWS